MFKFVRMALILVVVIYAASCEVNINPDINMIIEPEDALDFGFAQIYSTTRRSVTISNTGKKSIQLTTTGIEFYDPNTTFFEYSIHSGDVDQDVILNQNDSHEIEIAFTPKSTGSKEVNLVVIYIVGNKTSTIKYIMSGTCYSGFVKLSPPFLDYKPTYIAEKRVDKVSITNTDTKTLTVNAVYLSHYGSNTTNDEFHIVNGWFGNEIALTQGQTIYIGVEFKPNSYGNKSVSLYVNIDESSYDFNMTLRGVCCEPLEITTPKVLPNAIHGEPYNFMFSCVGGDGNYTYSAPNHNLPTGLSCISTKLTGTPEVHGSFGFSIVVTDDSGHSNYKTLSLQIDYAGLYRDPADVDPQYQFDKNNDTGMFIVNLIAEGKITLKIYSISLSGTGFNSGEATIITQPPLPHSMQDGDKTQVVIKIESYLEAGRKVKLTIDHTGYNSPFEKEFEWHVSYPGSNIFMINNSGSMTASYNGGYPVYDSNANIIPYPNKFQSIRSIVMEKIQDMPNTCKFDIIVFNTNVSTCFGSLTLANTNAKRTAVNWLFSQGTTGCDNSFDALKVAYNSYGQVDKVEYYTDGYPDTAISLGCNGCGCSSWIGNRILQDMQTWLQQQISWSAHHQLDAIQYGGSPLTYMINLGSLPNSRFIFR